MFTLAPWEPFRTMRRRDDVLDEMFRDFFRRPSGAEGGIAEPPVELAESDGEMTVKMEVPGVEKEQIQLTVADDHLVVRGETRREKEEKQRNFYRQEIRYGAFQRTIALPVEVDATKAKAELKNGILKVTLPKNTQPKARDVKVAVG